MSKRAFVIVLRIVFPLTGLALFGGSVMLAPENHVFAALGAAMLLGALVALSIVEEWLGHSSDCPASRPPSDPAVPPPAADIDPPVTSDDVLDAERFRPEPPSGFADAETRDVA
jgi:hypothetical protein